MMISLVVNNQFWMTVRVCATVRVELSTIVSDQGTARLELPRNSSTQIANERTSQ